MVTTANAGINKHPVDKYNSKYDTYFSSFTKVYFGPGFDYRQFKAQSIAESNLNPVAQSPVGAKGIMQIMDNTQKEIGKGENVYEPKWNIAYGISYDRKLYSEWTSERPFNDRMALTFASYNAGLGNPLKAQVLCNNNKENDCNLYTKIVKYSKYVSSQGQNETKGYVEKIMILMETKIN